MLGDVLTQLASTGTAVLVVLAATLAIYAAIVVATRLAGPRSLAKMSAFDLVATVALGSMVASVGLGSVPLVDGLVAVATLYALQFVVGLARRRRALGGAIDSQPLLLLRDGQVLEDHLRVARLTTEDLRSHLRLADVNDVGDVRAIVLETTGELSVLTGRGDLGPLLQGVRGAEEGLEV